MNLEPQLVERIVAEVLRRLSSLADTTPAAAAEPAPRSESPVRAAPAPPTTPDTLTLDARVITTASIHGRLNGIRSVVVDRSAVVTPSVRDELDKKHIRLERSEGCDRKTGTGNLAVIRCTRSVEGARCAATLPVPAAAAERVYDSLPEAVSAAAQATRDARNLVLMVTDEPLAAVCLLNRSPHVRAASARSADETRQAIAAIGANVLALDPRGVTTNQRNVVVKAFRSDVPRTIPPAMVREKEA